MDDAVVILGAGGHARVIADMLRLCGTTVVGFLDDRPAGDFPGMTILGTLADAPRYRAYGAVIGIGDNEIRMRVAAAYPFLRYVTAVHPSAVVAADARIGAGCAVMANAVVGTGSRIGAHCVVNTAATVDHDCELADFAHVGPGAHLSGTVRVGEASWLGTGALVNNNLDICARCVVGSGTVVIRNLTQPGTYVGVPARRLEK